MKHKYLRFLARNNLKGNKKSRGVVVLAIVIVFSLTLISAYSATLSKAVYDYKHCFRSRVLTLDPIVNPITPEIIDRVKKIDHVEDVIEAPPSIYGTDDLLVSVSGMEEINERLKKDNKTDDEAILWSAAQIEGEPINIIAGESLENSPTYSCLVPSEFYPFGDTYIVDSENSGHYIRNLKYIDGATLIGKTLTFRSSRNVSGYYNGGPDLEENDGKITYNVNTIHVDCPSLKFKLKVVGTYYLNPVDYGYYDILMISPETHIDITKRLLENANVDLSKSSKSMNAAWWNDKTLRDYYVVVDSYDNLQYVVEKMWNDEKYSLFVDNRPLNQPDETMILISTILSIAGTIFLIGALIAGVIVMIQASFYSARERRAELGVMRASGYRTFDIFRMTLVEQLILSVRGFLIGGAASAVLIVVMNYVNLHGYFTDRIYIVPWSFYFLPLIISFAIVFSVPIICQIINLVKIKKLSPARMLR